MLCVLAVLAAAPAMPQVTVVVSSRRDPANAVTPELVRRMREALTAVGLETFDGPDARTCEGDRRCISALAVPAGSVIVGVDAGRVGNIVAAHFEAVKSGDAASLTSGDLASDWARWTDAASTELDAFVRRLALKVQPIEPHVPPPAPPAAAVAETPSRVPGVALSIAGAASLAASVGLGLTALQSKSVIDASRYEVGGMTASRLPGSELTARANDVNARATAALITGLAAAALLATALWLLLRGAG